MARNTGRGSTAARPPDPPVTEAGEWSDQPSPDWEVWAEADGVAVYRGPHGEATHRFLFTPDEAEALGRLLLQAAVNVRGLQR